jgi:predicted transcriptional regulator
MKTDILGDLRTKLAGEKGRLGDVAKETGVPYSTMMKILQGATDNPRIRSVQRLVDYFDGRRKRKA